MIIDSSALTTHELPPTDALINASYDWHLDVPLLEDDHNRVASSLGITRLPSLLPIESDGTVVEHWSGLTGPAALAQVMERLPDRPRRSRF